MIHMVFDEDEYVADWVRRQIPHVNSFGDCVSIGVEVYGNLIAGCVYSRFIGHDIEMSFAATSPQWATKESLDYFFGYPFHQAGCVRVTATIALNNNKARDMVQRLGFEQEGIMKKAIDGIQDAVIYGMLKGNCKWINKEVYHGQKFTESTTST